MKTETETQKLAKQQIKEETVTQLLALEDKTIYARVKHRSSSNQSVWLDYFIVGKNRYTGTRELMRITWGVAHLLGESLDKKHEGIKVSGFNFNKPFEPIYNLFTFVLKMPDFQKAYRVEVI